ncbi:hypothetical protein Goklo_029448 [Gossypium klotzschianum]|uniref:RNase H type-1 domain-containing protein n=1 Tax=Gossypium klotzschianum TaxID=34286 RepID=A0A7J8W7M3_9ROSI|nr:hypothetical protein [Gossypium klotzschianum]
MLEEPLLSNNIAKKKWKKPPKGFIKINFDAAVGENRIGYGTIIRDEEGFVLGGGGGFKKLRVSVQEAECMAFKESIDMARRLKLREHVLFEMDHVELVNRINNLDKDVTVIGARIKECKAAFNFFKSAKLVWTERSCNNVANLLCKKMYSEAINSLFEIDYPSDIHNAVIRDVS